MIPPSIIVVIQQLAQQAGQSVQQWMANNPDKVRHLLIHGGKMAYEALKKGFK